MFEVGGEERDKKGEEAITLPPFFSLLLPLPLSHTPPLSCVCVCIGSRVGGRSARWSRRRWRRWRSWAADRIRRGGMRAHSSDIPLFPLPPRCCPSEFFYPARPRIGRLLWHWRRRRETRSRIETETYRECFCKLKQRIISLVMLLCSYS